MIKLYHYWRSSASYRVRIALELADIAWEPVEVNLLEHEQTSPQYFARNPQGLVPILEIHGQLLTQSLAIIEYLNEQYNLRLLPDNPISKARVRALSHAIAMEIHPVCNLRVARYAATSSDKTISTQEWMKHFIASGLSQFEAMLEEGNFCHGNSLSLADLCLVPQVYNAKRWGIDLESMPKIRRITEALETIPAFAAAHPDRQQG